MQCTNFIDNLKHSFWASVLTKFAFQKKILIAFTRKCQQQNNNERQYFNDLVFLNNLLSLNAAIEYKSHCKQVDIQFLGS